MSKKQIKSFSFNSGSSIFFASKSPDSQYLPAIVTISVFLSVKSSTVSTVYSAAKNVKTAVDNTKNALGNMNGIEGILNAGTVAATSIQNIAGNVQHAAATVGENYTDKEGQPTANDKVGAALGQIVDGAKEGEDVFRTGTEIKETTDAGVRLGGDILSGKGLK